MQGKAQKRGTPGSLRDRHASTREPAPSPHGCLTAKTMDRGDRSPLNPGVLICQTIMAPQKKLLGNVIIAANGLKALRVQPDSPPYTHIHTRTNNGPGSLLTSHAKTIKNSIFTKGQ